ncbi:MAG: hypothetical protein ACPGVU_03770 [Limisphaerales bacterium]
MASEIDQMLARIRSKLFAFCQMLDVGERRSHEDLLMSGCLSPEELELVKEHELRLEVRCEPERTYLARIEFAHGGACQEQSSSLLGFTHRAQISRTDLAAWVHRSILEGRNPGIHIEIRNGVWVGVGGSDDEQNDTITILADEPLGDEIAQRFASRLNWRNMEPYQPDDGPWIYSAQIPRRELGVLTESVVFEVLGYPEDSIDVEWAEFV